jgi:MFS transporter, AAHS family, 4-hydroxybenzoate transporter
VGWASGVGRLGSVLGSMLGGVLLSPGRQLSTAFAIVAVPAFVAGASMLAMGRLRAPAPAPARPAEAVAPG